MIDWLLHWRDDRGIMERLCPHGVGHPDPDDTDYIRRTRGDSAAEAQAVHGCDFCCRPDGPPNVDIDADVSVLPPPATKAISAQVDAARLARSILEEWVARLTDDASITRVGMGDFFLDIDITGTNPDAVTRLLADRDHMATVFCGNWVSIQWAKNNPLRLTVSIAYPKPQAAHGYDEKTCNDPA